MDVNAHALISRFFATEEPFPIVPGRFQQSPTISIDHVLECFDQLDRFGRVFNGAAS